jgi:hypothetical protein
MIGELLDLTVEEIKNGYQFDEICNKYVCNSCGKEFSVGEIYKFGERFFDSQRAVANHISEDHETVFELLIDSENKYLGLTENQKQLLRLTNLGLSDNEIAKQIGISPSTVRHQKFMFREKAKQAKMYLAVYELALIKKSLNGNLVIIHSTATMVDDRYITTTEESDKFIKNAFLSLSPLTLKAFPAREKKKIIVLKKIVEQFEFGKRYKEKEINQILKDIFEDYPTLRRYLIEYGFMERTKDCEEYWLK